MLACAVNLLLTLHLLGCVYSTQNFPILWLLLTVIFMVKVQPHLWWFLSRLDSPVFFSSSKAAAVCADCLRRIYLFLAELFCVQNDRFALSLLLAMSQLITVWKSSVKALKREWPQIAMFSESHANITQIPSSVVSVTPVYIITKK